MIIFGGWGPIAALFASGAFMWLVSTVSTSDIATGIGMMICGGATYLFGTWLNQNDVMELVDPQTQQPVVIRNRHHVFWISLRWWGVLFAIAGMATLFF
jgi:hypothetical protein